MVHIKFIGDLTYAKISIRNVKGFEEGYDVYSQTKKKNLMNAIQIARKIHNGEMTWMQHYNQCKRKVNGRHIKKEEEEDKDVLVNELNEASGRCKVIRRKRKRGVGSMSISDRMSCNKNNNNSDITMKKEECNNARRRCSSNGNRSKSLKNKNVKRNQLINNNSNNTLHIGGTHDIMDIVDNFIYTKKNLQYEQFDNTFNSLKQSIMSVKHNDNNFNVSKYIYI